LKEARSAYQLNPTGAAQLGNKRAQRPHLGVHRILNILLGGVGGNIDDSVLQEEVALRLACYLVGLACLASSPVCYETQ